jgi:hypothetical protein
MPLLSRKGYRRTALTYSFFSVRVVPNRLSRIYIAMPSSPKGSFVYGPERRGLKRYSPGLYARDPIIELGLV